jgi:hypothetical protein
MVAQFTFQAAPFPGFKFVRDEPYFLCKYRLGCEPPLDPHLSLTNDCFRAAKLVVGS